jgi:murein L,D-transpeptidase YafK
MAAGLHGLAAAQVDSILVIKSTRTMTLLSRGIVVKSYQVALGGQPAGPKEKQGDRKTPEGKYVIDSKNPRSRFHLGLRISYSNAADRARARKLGVNPGGQIMIHGLPPAFASVGAARRLTDWTDGCIAVTNEEIEEIWRLVRVGTKVEIRP